VIENRREVPPIIEMNLGIGEGFSKNNFIIII